MTEIKLKCKKRCNGREWIYRGNSPYYTTCPVCKSSINIRKNQVQVDNVVADQANTSQPEETERGELS